MSDLYTITRHAVMSAINYMGGCSAIPHAVADLLEAGRADPAVYRVRLGDDHGGARIEWIGGWADIPSEIAIAILDNLQSVH